MEENKHKDAILAFKHLMNQKGYRGKFVLDMNNMISTGNLEECLAVFLRITNGSKIDTPLHLQTFAAYKHLGDNILCVFQGGFNDKKGFSISAMAIINKAADRTQHYRFNNNNQIIGINAAIGLFPKPKP